MNISKTLLAVYLSLLVGVCSLFISSVAYPQVLTPLPDSTLYARCYTQLVGEFPPDNDALLMQVNARTRSGSQACVDLLKYSTLDANTGKLNLSDPQLILRTKILSTFHKFHRSWFSSMLYSQSTLSQADGLVSTAFVHDTGEGAYHLDRALFKPGTRYSEIVTSQKSYEGFRVSPSTKLENSRNPSSLAMDYSYNSSISKDANGNNVYATSPIVSSTLLAPQGMLVGVIDGIETKIPGYYDAPTTESNIRKDFGAGILGSQSYLMLNWGREYFTKRYAPTIYGTMDGGYKMPRRWSKAVFEDLLCRQLPVLRNSDVKIQTTTTVNTPPFRKSESCMACHHTMDNMAATVRDLSAVVNGGSGNFLFMAKTGNGTAAQETGLVDSNQNFYNMKPHGRLAYRTFAGTLIDQPVDSLQQLGATLATQDDLYLCAAKRYFEFFTGVSVPIYDFTDPTALPVVGQELVYREFIIQLADQLKNGQQDLMFMAESIIKSTFYADQNYGVREGP